MTPEHIIIAVSALGGIIGGMGMGGGTLLIPLLTLAAGLDQRIAQSVNLIAFVPMSLAALIVHGKNGYTDIKKGIPITFTALVGAVAGSLLARMSDIELLRRLFGGFLLSIGAYMLVKTVRDAIICLKRKRAAAAEP